MPDNTTEAGHPPSRLHDLVVVAFEARRAAELAEMIRRHGGIPVSAPAMREVPRQNPIDLYQYVEQLRAGRFDVVVLLTGVGLKKLVQQVADKFPPHEIALALRSATLVARGPKPVAALRELGLSPQWLVPEPHTWRELLAVLDLHVPLQGKLLAVHEYGVTNEELIRALTERGAQVHRVSIYQWDYPENVLPLRTGIRTILDGKAAVAVFTSASQVHNVWAFVEQEFESELDLWQTRIEQTIVASVGPICSQALRQHGVEPDLEASPPKMGALMHLVALHARSCLQKKRGQ